MIKYYANDPGNEGQDAFAMKHGEAHRIEFINGVCVGNNRCYVALASDHETAKHHAIMGNGKIRGYIRASDFGF